MMNAIKKLLGSTDAPQKTRLTPAAGEDLASVPSESTAYEAWIPDAPSTGKIELDEAKPVIEEETVSTLDDGSSSLDSAAEEPTSSDLEKRIIDAIKLVYDPEIPVNIYELGLIYAVDIAENKDLHIQMTLTAPACPVAGEMPGWVVAAVESNVEEIGNVEVELVWDPPWNPELMSEAAQLELGYL